MIKAAKAPRVLWEWCLMSSSRAVSGDSLSMQAVPLLCFSPAQPGVCVTQPCNSRALLPGECGWAKARRAPKEWNPPYSHQSHDDGCDTLGSRPTPAFYFIVQFLHAKCGSLLRLCRKTHELASAQAVRCLAAVNHLLRLDFCFNA